VIEAPEVDAQLAQAKADAVTALANYEIAKPRQGDGELVKTNAVSHQEAEQNTST